MWCYIELYIATTAGHQLGHTLVCDGINLDSLLNVTFLHMFRFLCTCCWCQQWNAVMAALWDRRLAVCCLFRIVSVESCWPCHLANLDCSFVEDCLWFISAEGEETTWWRRLLCNLSLALPNLWNFSLEVAVGLTPNNAAAWFCLTSAGSSPMGQPYSDQSNMAWGIHQLTGVPQSVLIPRCC